MLTTEQAAAADDAIDRILAAAARQVTADGVALDVALVNHFSAVCARWPYVHALVVTRLREAGDQDMLALAERTVCDD